MKVVPLCCNVCVSFVVTCHDKGVRWCILDPLASGTACDLRSPHTGCRPLDSPLRWVSLTSLALLRLKKRLKNLPNSHTS